MNKKVEFKTVSNKNEFNGLRTLWCEVFGDEPAFIDGMYANFGEDITGYIAADEEGRVVSALTCFLCGEFGGKPVYTSYAICTAPEFRGLGLAGALVERAKDEVLSLGGISLISPAEPSLELFYGAHGYEPFFFVSRADTSDGPDEDDEDFIFDEADDEYEKAEPKTELTPLDYIGYNKYREEFLAEIPHVKLNEHMLRLVQAESTDPDGQSGLFLINGGDAICAMNHIETDGDLAADNVSCDYDTGDAGSNAATAEAVHGTGSNSAGSSEIEELLVNPRLSSISSEIAEEVACRLAAHFGRASVKYKIPGAGHCQSMAAGLTEEIKEEASIGIPAYYGFPIE